MIRNTPKPFHEMVVEGLEEEGYLNNDTIRYIAGTLDYLREISGSTIALRNSLKESEVPPLHDKLLEYDRLNRSDDRSQILRDFQEIGDTYLFLGQLFDEKDLPVSVASRYGRYGYQKVRAELESSESEYPELMEMYSELIVYFPKIVESLREIKRRKRTESRGIVLDSLLGPQDENDSEFVVRSGFF